MNAGLQSLVSNWFRQGERDMPDDYIPPPLPAIAMLPVPEMTDEEKRLKVITDAHQYVEQIKQERIADRKTIEQLQSEKTDLQIRLKQEQRKSGLLELDVAERDNTIQTLQSEVIEHKGLLDLLRDINAKSTAAFDRLGITGQPKKNGTKNAKQKPKSKEAVGKETDQPAKADG